MRKTLSFILLFIFSLASSQSKDNEAIASKPIVSLNQIFQILEKKQLDEKIKIAITSEFVVLSSNNMEALEMYLKYNTAFVGKKIVQNTVDPKNTSYVSLNYNYPKNTLDIEIHKREDGKILDSKTISYNYYTYK